MRHVKLRLSEVRRVR